MARLSQYIKTDTSERRLARIERRVEDQLASPARRSSWLGLALAASLVAALGYVGYERFQGSHSPALVMTQPLSVPTAPETTTMTLADGSTVIGDRDTKVRVEHVDDARVEVSLESGKATFDVGHRPSRTFVVHAGNVSFVDLGTHFSLTLADGRLILVVDSGSVEVQRSVGNTLVAGGESWTGLVDPPPAPPTLQTSSAKTPTPGPKELLEAGNAARLANHPQDAAKAYDTLRKRYRTDPRASLAAFELGRLRMDALADPASAIEAFDDAIVLSSQNGGVLREDVEARRVDALSRAHRTADCQKAKADYMKRYPSGVHTSEVRGFCP